MMILKWVLFTFRVNVNNSRVVPFQQRHVIVVVTLPRNVDRHS